MRNKKTLFELRYEIEEHVETIDSAPYSSNLIGLGLSIIARDYGRDEANFTIDVLNLEDLGYSKV